MHGTYRNDTRGIKTDSDEYNGVPAEDQSEPRCFTDKRFCSRMTSCDSSCQDLSRV